jgi:subtilisin family serine protease
VPESGLPITAAWAFDGADGTGIDVAVIDSGVEYTHPDAAGPRGPGVAVSWDRDNQQVIAEEGEHEDLFGHGTACAAIIRRAAPASRVMSVRVLGARLSGKGEVFAAGLRWAVEHGARVVNLSLSTGKEEMFGLFHQVADEASHAGVVLVCAMNNIFSPTFPSQFSSVISVAACDGDDPFRLLANPSPPADFGAPGLDLEVAWMNGGHIVTTGNSFAAPHVTGLVARMLSKHPHLTPYQVKAVLRAVAGNAEA